MAKAKYCTHVVILLRRSRGAPFCYLPSTEATISRSAAVHSRPEGACFFRMMDFHLILISAALRLGKYCLLIWAHFGPISVTRSQTSWSSSGVHSLWLSCGRRLLCHRCRHCQRSRSCMPLAITPP